MPQAGLHGLAGVAVRKWMPARPWLLLGIILGNMLPDADNFAVAVATVGGSSTEGLHRTFTHSLFLVMAVVAVFYLIGRATRQPSWGNLGLGLGIGIVMHILLDLVIWFNGVEILWPIPSWVNFWSGFTPPVWFNKLLDTTEFLFFGLFFWAMGRLARQRGTDGSFLGWLRLWTWLQMALFVASTVLVYTMQKGFKTPYGLAYLLSLILTIGVTIRMRKTLE